MYKIELRDQWGKVWEAHDPVDDLAEAKRIAKSLVHPDWPMDRAIEVVDAAGQVVTAYHRNGRGDAVPI